MIIFLDIDGVLAALDDLHKGRLEKRGDEAFRYGFSPQCVDVLNDVVKQTGARVVISSSWRMFGFDRLKAFIAKQGVVCDVIGMTPYVKFSGTARGREIRAWIDDNKYDGAFAVVDDEVYDISEYFDTGLICQTDGQAGLTEKDGRKIKEILYDQR